MPHQKYKVIFLNDAVVQLQQSIYYYNALQNGLGKRFGLKVKSAAEHLVKNPIRQIRYDDIRCLPLSKFPFMIHFRVNEALNLVEIFAVLHTSLDPKWDVETNEQRKDFL